MLLQGSELNSMLASLIARTDLLLLHFLPEFMLTIALHIVFWALFVTEGDADKFINGSENVSIA